MAQIDTGLGWSAKEEWLMQTASTVAEISEVTGGYELPVIPGATYTDIMNNGPWGYYRPQYRDGVKLVAEQSYIFGFAWNDGTYLRPMAVAYGDNKSIRWCVSWGSTALTENLVTAVTNRPNWYYGSVSNVGRLSQNPTTDLPIVSASSAQAAAALVIDGISIVTASINKTNPGFCVACVAKWKTQNNTVLESPILISTETDYVDMDTTLTGINLAKLNALYSGRKFFMSFYDRPYTGSIQTNLQVLDMSSTESPTFTLEELFRFIAKEINANIQVIYAPDPYQEGEGSEEGGMDGEEDEEDDVDFTDPPSTSIGATGLLTIFCPNLYQLQSLGSYMWSTFDVDNWRKIIANPMDAILGLHTIPVPAIITGTKAVKVAGIDTTIDMSYTTVRYIRRTMGSCEIPKKWGAYLDYSPYTKISIFLPFIGFKELDADDIMGKTISLQYMIDILTGACVAELKCEDTVLYTWSGNCANEVPISGSDWRGAIASAIGIAATVAGTALVTGGATAPMAASMVASVGANSMNLKPTINRSGAISGSAGYMGQKRPYIIRSIPNLVIPTDQNKFIGYPSFVTASLGSLVGYNEIASIHLEGIPATGNELAEIETLLKGGVIF